MLVGRAADGGDVIRRRNARAAVDCHAVAIASGHPRKPVEKKCPDCEKMVPMAEFRGQGVCPTCNYARVKRWRLEHPERTKEQYHRRVRRKQLVRRARTDMALREDLEFFRGGK